MVALHDGGKIANFLEKGVKIFSHSCSIKLKINLNLVR